EAAAIRAQALKEAAEEHKRLVDAARAESHRLIDGARAQMEADVRRARDELRREVAELATAVAEKLVRKSLRDEDHRRLLAAAIKRNAAAEAAARLEVVPLTRDFLALAAAHGRAQRLPGIAAAYRELVDAAAGRVRARVRTATPLADGEREALAGRLSRVLG